MAERKIAYLGANSDFGRAMVDALTSAGWHVVILAHTLSAYTPQPGTTIVPFDIANQDALVSTLRGCTVLLCSVSGGARSRGRVDSFELQKSLIDAAIIAGVQRYIPSEYAADQSHPKSLQLPIYNSRRKVLEYLRMLASQGKIEYTAFHSGALFEWGLSNGWLGFDIPHRTARILDGGNIPFVVSTYAFCGRVTARAISQEHFASTTNKELKVGGGRISQNELLSLVEDSTHATFSVQHQTAQECLKQGLDGLQSGNVTPEVVRDCIVSTGFTENGAFGWELDDNADLGVTVDDLSAAVRTVIDRY